jgi:hypothetical protein
VHDSYYLARGLRWPPNLEDISSCEGLSDQRLTQRQLEVVFYCTSIFPYSADKADADGFQFLDVNRSLERLTGEGGATSPWLPRLNTLTTNSLWFLRRCKDKKIIHHALEGIELMNLFGYDQQLCQCSFEHFDSESLAILARNAMNGFALMAFFSSHSSQARSRLQKWTSSLRKVMILVLMSVCHRAAVIMLLILAVIPTRVWRAGAPKSMGG